MKKDVFENLYGTYSLDNYLTDLKIEKDIFAPLSAAGLGLTAEACTFQSVDGGGLIFSNLIGVGSSFLGAKIAHMTSKKHGLKDAEAIFNTELVKNLLVTVTSSVYLKFNPDQLSKVILYAVPAMILGSGITYAKHLQNMSKQAMSESKLVEVLKKTGNIEPSKNGNSIITSDILKEVNQYNYSNSQKKNVVGLNSGLLEDFSNKMNSGMLVSPYSKKGLETRALKSINYKNK